MKKILLLVSVLALVLVGCSDGIPEKISDKAPNLDKITQVKPSYIVELIENKSSFVFYFGSSVCGACQYMKNVNNEVVERKSFPIYYIEMDKTSDKQLNMIYKYVVKPQATPESFTPEIIVGDDTGFVDEHFDLYVVNLISVLKAKGLMN